MGTEFTEQQVLSEPNELREAVARTDRKIQDCLAGFAKEGEFDWDGFSLSKAFRVRVIHTPESTVVTVEDDNERRIWLATSQDGTYEVGRVVDQQDGKDPLFVPLPLGNLTVEDKYERDALLDALNGCQRGRYGVDSLLKF